MHESRNYLDCIDTKVSKRKIIRLCKKLGLLYECRVNINGGKYIKVIESKHIDEDHYIVNTADIYYRCIINWLLYRGEKADLNDTIKFLNEVKNYEDEKVQC